MSLFRLASRSTTVYRSAVAARTLPNRFVLPRATYASGSGLSRDSIQSRILDVLKGNEKVDPSKLTATASFSKDLGLDSLDAVEVVMAVEEEFSIEIPDAEADEIQTVAQAIDYIAKTPDAH
ncbi:acyl carrier protein-like protein [Coprinopsis sp. MPI-PUGE-AT-0042]|nr:acyl carrier protein-like protein [Coprinopsis sp. MPI-PUGE-AT-0042]